jgi:hypothetical protein
MATGEALAHLNCLITRGVAVREEDASGIGWYRSLPHAGAATGTMR